MAPSKSSEGGEGEKGNEEFFLFRLFKGIFHRNAILILRRRDRPSRDCDMEFSASTPVFEDVRTSV